MRKTNNKYNKISINLGILTQFRIPKTISDISKLYEIDKTGASRFVNDLENKGLIKVKSRIGSNRGRKTNVFVITDFGDQILIHFNGGSKVE